jgi:hypothetical protein
MKYFLLINAEEALYDKMSEQELGGVLEDYGKFTQDLEKAGILLSSHRLQPIATATTVRVRNGKTLTTDGPFAETKEQFGGYYLIDAQNLDEAVKWAARVPCAVRGSVEVRPVWE